MRETSKTPVEILTEAKAILMEGTWGKAFGGTGPPLTGYCAITAVAEAERRIYGFVKMTGGAASYLGRATMDRGYTGIHLFNDDPKTTFDDVMDLYDDAIRMAKEAEGD